jgi:uncharacterized membrane protein YfcA
MFAELHSAAYPLLFTAGLIAGTVDAVAGGGGLISLPVLLSVGIPPHIALGTNKLQSCIGTSIATWSYHRHGLISWRTALRGIVLTFIGATTGAFAAQIISGAILKSLIPLLLLVILIYAIFAPKFGAEDRTPKLTEAKYFLIFGLLLGFYDGFLGPGAGSFWVVSLTFCLGYNITKATAYTKVFNLTSNLAAFVCFALANNIDYSVGLCMAAGQLIGGRLGAQIAIKNGATLIRPIFLVMVSATIVTLLYRQFFAS